MMTTVVVPERYGAGRWTRHDQSLKVALGSHAAVDEIRGYPLLFFVLDVDMQSRLVVVVVVVVFVVVVCVVVVVGDVLEKSDRDKAIEDS